MLSYARACGMHVAAAVAEALPFADASFDYVPIVTTFCFVDDAHAMLREAHRVLRMDGDVVIGLIDLESPIRQHHLAHQAKDVFCLEARFYSAVEVDALLGDAGFADLIWLQILSVPLSQIREMESLATGTDHGAFLVVHGRA